MSSSVLKWRAPLWVAVSTVMSFVTGCGSFVYLVVTGNGNLVLVIGCWAFAGIIPPLVALERMIALRTGSGTPSSSSSSSSGESSQRHSPNSSDGGDV